MRVTVTKKFTFDAAHYLSGHEGKCAAMHGHTYILEVTVGAPGAPGAPGVPSLPFEEQLIHKGSSRGMVIDFSHLKKLVEERLLDRWDHKTINEVEGEDYQPTAECMAHTAFWILRAALLPNYRLIKIRLWETPTSYAEVTDPDARTS